MIKIPFFLTTIVALLFSWNGQVPQSTTLQSNNTQHRQISIKKQNIKSIQKRIKIINPQFILLTPTSIQNQGSSSSNSAENTSIQTGSNDTNNNSDTQTDINTINNQPTNEDVNTIIDNTSSDTETNTPKDNNINTPTNSEAEIIIETEPSVQVATGTEKSDIVNPINIELTNENNPINIESKEDGESDLSDSNLFDGNNNVLPTESENSLNEITISNSNPTNSITPPNPVNIGDETTSGTTINGATIVGTTLTTTSSSIK
jgi:hypothetical protein